MSRYVTTRKGFKITQFVIFLLILLFEIFLSSSWSVNQWIITGYLLIFSFCILLSIKVTRLYSLFPFIAKGYKLSITVFIMAGFAFDEDMLKPRSFLALGLIILSLIFLGVSLCYSDEEKIEDIVMTKDDSFGR